MTAPAKTSPPSPPSRPGRNFVPVRSAVTPATGAVSVWFMMFLLSFLGLGLLFGLGVVYWSVTPVT